MKRIGYFFIAAGSILILLVSGCGDDSPTQGTINGNQYLVISGKLPIDAAGINKSINFALKDGKTPITSLTETKANADSTFKLTVPPPIGKELKPITEFFIDLGSQEAPQISNPKAKFIQGVIALLREGKQYGAARWISVVNDSSTDLPGNYKAHYYYFDRDVEIKGTVVSAMNGPIDYNFSAKAGWNIIYYRRAPNVNDAYVNKTQHTDGYYECAIYAQLTDFIQDDYYNY